jgi:general stress protein 26
MAEQMCGICGSRHGQMQRLPEEVSSFLKKQGFVIVSTLTKDGRIHCAAKGIVGVEEEGKLFIFDLYQGSTYDNLQNNRAVSVTAVNEETFQGWTLQGTAKIVPREQIPDGHLAQWQQQVIRRITDRLIKRVRQEKTGVQQAFEAHLPESPRYLIEIDVSHIVNLLPPDVRK